MNTRIAALSIVLAGCLPIPVKKTYVMWPGRTIRVVDEKGSPIAGAKVRLVRDRHPHGKNDEVRELTTDEKGEVKVERETKVLKVFPLMMHGVPGFSFRACAESKGTAGTTTKWPNPEESSDLVLKLLPGSKPCEEELDQTAPAAKTARIEAVEKQEDGRFIVQLALPPDGDPKGLELSKPGAEPLKVTDVVWQSPGGPPLLRARVHVSGDPLTYAHGDVVACR